MWKIQYDNTRHLGNRTTAVDQEKSETQPAAHLTTYTSTITTVSTIPHLFTYHTHTHTHTQATFKDNNFNQVYSNPFSHPQNAPRYKKAQGTNASDTYIPKKPNHVKINRKKHNRRPSPGWHQTSEQRSSSHNHHEIIFDLDLLHPPPIFSPHIPYPLFFFSLP